jgi:hypothetical protein
LANNLLTGTLPNFANRNIQNLYVAALFHLTMQNIEQQSAVGKHTRLRDAFAEISVSSSSNRALTAFRRMLSNCSLNGMVPAFRSSNQLAQLYLNDNFLSGSLPDISNSTTLQMLFLQRNSLSGPFFASNLNLTNCSLDGNDNLLCGGWPTACEQCICCAGDNVCPN